MTLMVPSWTRDLHAPGWANIHDIINAPPRLTAVDAFLGDPHAHTLILGKDCAPASEFRKRVSRGESDPYRHNPRLPTNRMLSAMLRRVGVAAALDGSNSATCGCYYANAYWLLRDDNHFSGALQNKEEAYRQSAHVLAYLFESLRPVRVIAMGEDAYQVLMRYLGLEECWRVNLEERRAVMADGVKLCASSHLGYFGTRNRIPRATREECMSAIQEDWARAFQ